MPEQSELPDGELPTLKEWLESWLPFQLPSIPLPQTLKNTDKAIATVVAALGHNLEERVFNSTKMVKLEGQADRDEFRRSSEDARKLSNRADIVKLAIEEVQSDPGAKDATSEIESDWLNLFARYAEDKSSEELKLLFGRILAGEIRQPGLFSLRTLQFFSVLTRTEAEQLSTFLSFALDGKMVPYDPANLPTSPDANLQTLMLDLGVVSSGSYEISKLSKTYTVDPNTRLGISAIGFAILVENKSEKEIKFNIAGQRLTTIGREVFRIANPAKIQMSFLESITANIANDLRRRYTSQFDAGAIVVSIGLISEERDDGIVATIIKTFEP